MSESLHAVLHAVSYASRQHEGQRRKDGTTPYVSHVVRVAFIVQRLFGHDDADMVTAAVLHDTLEDTRSDFDEIAERFSPRVAKWVAALSKDKRLEESEREDAYLKQLLSADWQVQVCKLADIYDNLLDMDSAAAARTSQVLSRARHYLDGLARVPNAKVKRAWNIVETFWQQRARQV
jgi:guanosine-3',5'-bis(diphosphate) 3'-pyrophosphohydrolase